MEYEFVSMSHASKYILWIRLFLKYILFIDRPKGPVTFYCDNKASIHNTVMKRITSDSKCIAKRYSHIRSTIKKVK